MKEQVKIVKAARDKGYRSVTQIMRDMSARGWEAVNIRHNDDSVLITFTRDN